MSNLDLLKESIVDRAREDYVRSCVGLKAIENDLIKNDYNKTDFEWMKNDVVRFVYSEYGEDCGILDPDMRIKQWDKLVEEQFNKLKEDYEESGKKITYGIVGFVGMGDKN